MGSGIIDVLREKLEFPELKAAVLVAAKNWSPNAILIEDKASGQALIQELKKKTSLPIISIIPTKDKFMRLLGVSSLFEAGNILLPTAPPWLPAYEHELTNFPNVEHDDMVDSTTQFLQWMRDKGAGRGGMRVV